MFVSSSFVFDFFGAVATGTSSGDLFEDDIVKSCCGPLHIDYGTCYISSLCTKHEGKKQEIVDSCVEVMSLRLEDTQIT